MADFSYDDAYGVDEAAQGASVTTFVNWAGAAVSLALLAGLGYWGWQLLVRDVSGVPVITALEGPMRVAPDNPGGEIASHQGLAVNQVAAVGEAAPGPDQVVLAPAPNGLTEEDAAMATLLPDATEEAVVAETEVVATAPGQATSVLAADPTLNMSPTDLAVLTALAELEPDLLADPSAAPAAEIVPAVATAGTPRPQPRPAGFGAAPAAAAVVTPAVATAADMQVAEVVELSTGAEAEVAMTVTPVSTASAGLDVDPASVPVGSRLVQLGAFPTEAEAIAEWDRIGDTFAEYMDGKRRLIQQAETGGTSFYRLRAVGFADLSDARRFCAVLVAGNASCIPVVAR